MCEDGCEDGKKKGLGFDVFWMGPRLAIESEFEKRLLWYLPVVMEGVKLLPEGRDEGEVEVGELNGSVASESQKGK